MSRYLFVGLGLAFALGCGYLLLRERPTKAQAESHTIEQNAPLDREEIDQLSREVRSLRRQVSLQARLAEHPSPKEEDGEDETSEAPKEPEPIEESAVFSPEERRELAFAEEERVAETIAAASFASKPLSKAKADDLVAKFSDKVQSIGAEFTAVRCTADLCQADLSYPPDAKAEEMDRAIVQDLCRGECWVRRLPDRSKWQIFAANEGGRLPEVGPTSTN